VIIYIWYLLVHLLDHIFKLKAVAINFHSILQLRAKLSMWVWNWLSLRDLTHRIFSSDVRVGILLTCGKHLHEQIFSQRGQVWAQTKTSLTQSIFIELSVSIQQSERSCICVQGVSICLFWFNCNLAIMAVVNKKGIHIYFLKMFFFHLIIYEQL
jgi:hypothetical protein